MLAWHGGNTWTSLERLVQQSTTVRDALYTEASKDAKNQKVCDLNQVFLISHSLDCLSKMDSSCFSSLK